MRAKTEIRPLFSRLTPHGATNTRSPLVSMIFPSLKDKIRMFQDETIKKETVQRVGANPGASKSSMNVKRTELEKIVEQETKRRNDNY